MANLTVELAQRGQLTLPKHLCEQHHWETGQQFTLLDIDGVVVMTPKDSKIDAIADQLREDLIKEGANLEEMLTELRRARETAGV
jgi:bifunctional DNA-binding transcriptional regulator/antitoxin component of YhaV-PrlF toxin-antitoxin module